MKISATMPHNQGKLEIALEQKEMCQKKNVKQMKDEAKKARRRY